MHESDCWFPKIIESLSSAPNPGGRIGLASSRGKGWAWIPVPTRYPAASSGNCPDIALRALKRFRAKVFGVWGTVPGEAGTRARRR